MKRISYLDCLECRLALSVITEANVDNVKFAIGALYCDGNYSAEREEQLDAVGNEADAYVEKTYNIMPTLPRNLDEKCIVNYFRVKYLTKYKLVDRYFFEAALKNEG